MDDNIPIFLLPGMTPEYPVYTKILPLLPAAKVVSFIDPKPRESLGSYAGRMASRFPKPCFIGGVSFGAIVAQEVARLIQPAGCIVIAGVRKPSELPPWIRVWRIIRGQHAQPILNTVGRFAGFVPNRRRTPSTTRLTKLAGATGAWHRWATSAVLDWAPSKPIDTRIIHIHGDEDTTFPIRYTSPDTVIRQGSHALPMSHPKETASAIAAFTRAHS